MKSTRLSLLLPILLVASSCNAPGRSAASELILRGRVVDARTNTPIPFSSISVNGARAEADSTGRFELHLRRPPLIERHQLPEVQLSVLRFGYSPLRLPLLLRADTLQDLGTLSLKQQPLHGDPIGTVRKPTP